MCDFRRKPRNQFCIIRVLRGRDSIVIGNKISRSMYHHPVAEGFNRKNVMGGRVSNQEETHGSQLCCPLSPPVIYSVNPIRSIMNEKNGYVTGPHILGKEGYKLKRILEQKHSGFRVGGRPIRWGLLSFHEHTQIQHNFCYLTGRVCEQ